MDREIQLVSLMLRQKEKKIKGVEKVDNKMKCKMKLDLMCLDLSTYNFHDIFAMN